MMLVSEYINLLVTGELKPIAVGNIGGDHRNETQEENVQTLVRFLDLARKSIYEKFALFQRELILKNIRCNKPKTLPSDFLYPIAASTRDGSEIFFNNERRTFVDGMDTTLSLMFPEPYICLPKGDFSDYADESGEVDISLLYAAEPVRVEDVNDDMKLPGIYTQAVINFVAYKVFASIDGHIEQTNNTYYMRYIRNCEDIKINGGSIIDNLDSNIKLEERGWV